MAVGAYEHRADVSDSVAPFEVATGVGEIGVLRIGGDRARRISPAQAAASIQLRPSRPASSLKWGPKSSRIERRSPPYSTPAATLRRRRTPTPKLAWKECNASWSRYDSVEGGGLFCGRTNNTPTRRRPPCERAPLWPKTATTPIERSEREKEDYNEASTQHAQRLRAVLRGFGGGARGGGRWEFLLRECKATLTATYQECSVAVSGMHCLGFIDGLVDMNDIYKATVLKGSSRGLFCLPKDKHLTAR